MKIEDLVLSIEQMNHLKELGLEVKDTALAWVNARVGHNFVAPIDIIFHNDYIPTLTLQEILEMLPKKISVDGFENDFYFSHEHNAIDHFDKMRYWAYKHCTLEGSEIIKETEFECAYAMLCWVAEHGYLNASKSMPLNK